MHIIVIGAGRMGLAHVKTLADLGGVDTLSIADLDVERARRAADSVGGRALSIDDAMESSPDGIVIVAPTPVHADLIMRAVDAGIPTFCEKPVAESLDRTRAIVDYVAARDVAVQIGFQRRFDPGYRAAKTALEDGRLGSLRRAHLLTCDPRPPAAKYIPTSGGIFRDCAIHDFDMLRWMTGHEAETIFATGANRGADFFAVAGDVDEAATIVTMDDGTLATTQSSRYNGAGYDVRMELAGTDGQITVGLDDRAPIRSAEADVDFPRGKPWPDFQSRFQQAYRHELQTFVDVAAGRATNPCTPQDALAALYMAEAAELSRRDGRTVKIAEVAQ